MRSLRPGGRAPRAGRAAALLLAGLAASWPGEARAWTSPLQEAMNRDARKLLPRSLRKLLAERETQILEEVRRFPVEVSQALARDVTAGTLFGKPSSGFINTVQSTVPPINIGHPYTDRTVDLCIETDPVCSPTGGDGRATTCTRPTAWSNRPPTTSPRESWRGQHGRHTEG